MSIDVGPIENFAEGTVRIVQAAGREIGIIRWAGAIYALNNVCSHQSGPVCSGILGPRLTGGRPGAMELDAATPVLACPWHGWEFDLLTGRALTDPHRRLRLYSVTRQGDELILSSARPKPRTSSEQAMA
jgi:nitrite reductase/ring-hydroxylating ferredoxin subunit